MTKPLRPHSRQPLGYDSHRRLHDDRIGLVSPAPAEDRVNLRINCRNCGSVVGLAADSLERDLTGARHNPGVHAKGNVVVRLRVSDEHDGTPSFMMLYADAVTYREDTDELQPSGKVRITFHKSEPQLAQ
jgi:hypothetical protein